MRRDLSGRGASLLELIFVFALFSALTLISVVCLKQVSGVWQKSSSRDRALRDLLKAESVLHRDLVNASKGHRQSQFGPILAGTGGVNTSDGLALVLPHTEQEGLALSLGGSVVLNRLVTYYLAAPSNLTQLTGLNHNFVADSQGYEDQCAYKWLIRRESDAIPAGPNRLSEVPPNWLTSGVIEVPTQMWREPQRRVVASNLLQFRVLQGPPMWEIRLTAVAVDDARRKLNLGSVPLSGTVYTLTHRVAVVAQN